MDVELVEGLAGKEHDITRNVGNGTELGTREWKKRCRLGINPV